MTFQLYQWGRKDIGSGMEQQGRDGGSKGPKNLVGHRGPLTESYELRLQKKVTPRERSSKRRMEPSRILKNVESVSDTHELTTCK